MEAWDGQKRCERNYSSGDNYVFSITQDPREKTEDFNARDMTAILKKSVLSNHKIKTFFTRFSDLLNEAYTTITKQKR